MAAWITVLKLCVMLHLYDDALCSIWCYLHWPKCALRSCRSCFSWLVLIENTSVFMTFLQLNLVLLWLLRTADCDDAGHVSKFVILSLYFWSFCDYVSTRCLVFITRSPLLPLVIAASHADRCALSAPTAWQCLLPDCRLLAAELSRLSAYRLGTTCRKTDSADLLSLVQKIFSRLLYILIINWLSLVDLAVVPLLRPP